MSAITAFSGSLLVVRDGEVVARASVGAADASAGTVCSADTRFQIASVSKQFTAAAVMLLVDGGFVELDDPIGRLLPGCARPWRELTLHQLLSHTSGLEHWTGLPGFDVTQPGRPDEFLERFAEVPLRSEPSGTWHYSSPGYLLAARVVEEVSGAAYADYLTSRIIHPLGMTATVVGRTPIDSAAWGYRGGQRVDVAQFAAIPGTGDVWSTVGDLARYTEAFEAGELLSSAARQALTARHADLKSAELNGPVAAHAYGYGYFLGSIFGRQARFHPGDNPGYQSFLGYLPDIRATVAILCNNEETDLDELLHGLSPELAGTETDLDVKLRPAPIGHQPH